MRHAASLLLLSGCHLWFGSDDPALAPDAAHVDPVAPPVEDAGVTKPPDCATPDAVPPPPPDAPPPPPDAPPPPPDAPPPPPDAPPPPPDAPPLPRKRVFLTSAPYDASFASIANGDALAAGDFLCNAAAQSVFAGGTWRVWLSTASTDAIDRIADVGPWYRMTGDTIVFNNKANLYTLPLAPIDQHETGDTVLWGAHYAWTGTLVGGDAAAAHCESWSTMASDVAGVIGSAKATSASWVDIAEQACHMRARLYCFEQ